MGKVAQIKLQYFGHVTRGSAGNLALTVLEGSIDGLRHQGRPKRQWMDDVEEWSGCSYIQLKEMSQDRKQWRKKTIEWSSAVANRHRWWLTSEWVSEWHGFVVRNCRAGSSCCQYHLYVLYLTLIGFASQLETAYVIHDTHCDIMTVSQMNQKYIFLQ